MILSNQINAYMGLMVRRTASHSNVSLHSFNSIWQQNVLHISKKKNGYRIIFIKLLPYKVFLYFQTSSHTIMYLYIPVSRMSHSIALLKLI